MSESWLRLAEVCRRTGHSTSSLYRVMAAGTFPRPRKRGHVSLWLESEVEAVIAREAATLPVAQLGGGARPKKAKPRSAAA